MTVLGAAYHEVALANSRLREELRTQRNAIIEECAQVAVVADITEQTGTDQYGYEDGYVEGFLDCEARFRAAIRALKQS